jgi:hypothetical protein
MATVYFAVRGDSLNARHSKAGKIPSTFYSATSGQPSVIASTALTGQIGSGVIDCVGAGGVTRGLVYPGRTNLPASNDYSVLIRCGAATWASSVNLFSIQNGNGGTQGVSSLFLSGTNSWRINLAGATANVTTNTSIATFSPSTTAFMDVLITYQISGSNVLIKLYIDGTLRANTSFGATNLDNPRDVNFRNIISLAATNSHTTSTIYINEFVIFDGVVDPSNVTLESGSGALNGSARTSFVAATAFDGLENTDPGIANVREGTSYTQAGLALTGTLPVGDTTNPGASNVKEGVEYSIDGVEFTGTLPYYDFSTNEAEMIATITDNLKIAVGGALGSDYTEIKHVTDVTKNVWKGSSKRYGVRPLDSTEAPGVLGYHTQLHTFEILVTDSYTATGLGDSEYQNKVKSLQDKLFDIYPAIVRNRAGSPTMIVSIDNFTMSQPEDLERDEVVVQRATVSIRYRQSIN